MEPLSDFQRNCGHRPNAAAGYAVIARYRQFDRIGFSIEWACSPDSMMLVAVPILWPWLIFLALQVFQLSMRQAHIRTTHTLRCVLYSYDVTIAVCVVGACTLMIAAILLPTILRAVVWVQSYAYGGVILITFYRLWISYRRYLRMGSAFMIVFLAHVVAVLLLMIVILQNSTRMR